MGHKALRVIVALVLLVAAVWIWGPRETPEWQALGEIDLTNPEIAIAGREAQYDGITPGAEARILWVGAPGQVTRYSVLYIHGFVATSEEIRPVPDRVAEALGANLVFARIRGHGRGTDALEVTRAGQWIEDALFYIEAARAVGQEVLIISNSNGGTLTAIAMTEDGSAEGIAGLVFLSPNFRLTRAAGALFQAPWARLWLPFITGRQHCIDPISEAHETYFTLCIPVQGGITVGTMMGEAARRDYGDVDLPALFIISDADQVSSPIAGRMFAENWGGPAEVLEVVVPEVGGDAFSHVLAGDILSPALTDQVTDDILTWLYHVGIGPE